MIQSYKKKPQLDKSYDVILIGTGIGCLCAGALLAKSGKKVLLLERHYTPGGFTHVFKRRGFEWDVGIHYIGEVQRPNSILRKLFDISEFFDLISLKKFQAKTKIVLLLPLILDLFLMGILTPGINFPCFNLLSSTIQSISFEIPKKFNAVVALAGDP